MTFSKALTAIIAFMFFVTISIIIDYVFIENNVEASEMKENKKVIKVRKEYLQFRGISLELSLMKLDLEKQISAFKNGKPISKNSSDFSTIEKFYTKRMYGYEAVKSASEFLEKCNESLVGETVMDAPIDYKVDVQTISIGLDKYIEYYNMREEKAKIKKEKVEKKFTKKD